MFKLDRTVNTQLNPSWLICFVGTTIEVLRSLFVRFWLQICITIPMIYDDIFNFRRFLMKTRIRSLCSPFTAPSLRIVTKLNCTMSHRKIRKDLSSFCQPGAKLYSVAEFYMFICTSDNIILLGEVQSSVS